MRSSDVARGTSADELVRTATKHTYWRDEAEEGGTPVDGLLALFDRADVIVGFNTLGFDHLLLRRFYGRQPQDVHRYFAHRSKALDLMMRLRDVTNVYYKLDALLVENGLPCKTGSAAEAPKLWANSQRDQLEDYCAADVELTARLALVENLRLPGGTVVPHNVHGMRSAVAARRAAEEAFVVVHNTVGVSVDSHAS